MGVAAHPEKAPFVRSSGARTEGIRIVCPTARISHFTSKDKLTFAFVYGREHVIDHTLTELETQLYGRRFARIHRATIVNIGFVQEMFPAVDGGVLVRLRDEKKTELSVARDRVRELKQRLGI